jgi:Na+-translocating ferredoxin:NAD+ oxidoreductase RnfG subunit
MADPCLIDSQDKIGGHFSVSAFVSYGIVYNLNSLLSFPLQIQISQQQQIQQQQQQQQQQQKVLKDRVSNDQLLRSLQQQQSHAGKKKLRFILDLTNVDVSCVYQ